MINFLLVFVCVILVVTGQLFLKHGMLRIGPVALQPEHIFAFLQKAITSPFIIFGLGLYVVSSMLWLILISRKELSFVQPLTALVYVFILFFSWLLFKENVGLTRILGVCVISLGVFLVARS